MSTDFIRIIHELLPGFIAAWVFNGLTAHPRRSDFERIVQALIFSGFVRVIVTIIEHSTYGVRKSSGFTFGDWNPNLSFVLSVFIAIMLGVLFSCLANRNLPHKLFPEFITKRTSYPSEWFSAFNEDKRYVYLHLVGDRRIYGWPQEWPDTPGSGHFVLVEAEWILDDNTRARLFLTRKILIPASEVVMVEFEKKKEEYDFTEEDQNNSVTTLIRLRNEESRSDNGEEEKSGGSEPPH